MRISVKKFMWRKQIKIQHFLRQKKDDLFYIIDQIRIVKEYRGFDAPLHITHISVDSFEITGCPNKHGN